MQAFRRSLKKSGREKEKKEDKEEEEKPCSNPVLTGLARSPLTCSPPGQTGQQGGERRERRSGEDGLEYEVRTDQILYSHWSR